MASPEQRPVEYQRVDIRDVEHRNFSGAVRIRPENLGGTPPPPPADNTTPAPAPAQQGGNNGSGG
jgi:hypothetical protein